MSNPGSAAEHACTLCRDRSAAGGLRRPSIGRPFTECLRCGAQIERHGANEWDLHSRAARWAILARRIRFALIAGLVPPLVYAGLSLAGSRQWDPRNGLLFLAGGWLAACIFEAVRLSTEIAASRERMSDPMYRAKLVQHGIAASRTVLEET